MVNLRRDMIQGLVRLRILRAAMGRPISGVELSDDLATAGHRVGPGTLYPLLHDLEKLGWLKSKGKTVKGKRRRYYRITKKGRAQLEQALIAVNQFLFDELEQPLASSTRLLGELDGGAPAAGQSQTPSRHERARPVLPECSPLDAHE